MQVPQTFALNVKQGQSATVSLRQLPGRSFSGLVTRTAGTIDPASRTLNTEIDVPNPNAELLAGMFGSRKSRSRSNCLTPSSVFPRVQ